MKSILALIALPALLASCAALQPGDRSLRDTAQLTAEVQPQSDGSFVISRPATRGGPRTSELKAQALKQADAYCASLSKGLKVEEALATSTRPSGYEVRFSCEAKPTPE